MGNCHKFVNEGVVSPNDTNNAGSVKSPSPSNPRNHKNSSSEDAIANTATDTPETFANDGTGSAVEQKNEDGDATVQYDHNIGDFENLNDEKNAAGVKIPAVPAGVTEHFLRMERAREERERLQRLAEIERLRKIADAERRYRALMDSGKVWWNQDMSPFLKIRDDLFQSQEEKCNSIRKLVQKGYDLNIAGANKMTSLALWCVLELEEPEAAAVLVDLGCLMELKDWEGRTALWHAVGHANVETVRVLLARGAVADFNYEKHTSLVHESFRKVYSKPQASRIPEILTLLKEHFVLFDEKDDEGRTPLDFIASPFIRANLLKAGGTELISQIEKLLYVPPPPTPPPKAIAPTLPKKKTLSFSEQNSRSKSRSADFNLASEDTNIAEHWKKRKSSAAL